MTRHSVGGTTLGVWHGKRRPIAALTKRYRGWYHLWARYDVVITCFSPGRGIMAPGTCTCTKDGKMILKWDLENSKAMRGRPTKRVLALIRELQAERLL